MSARTTTIKYPAPTRRDGQGGSGGGATPPLASGVLFGPLSVERGRVGEPVSGLAAERSPEFSEFIGQLGSERPVVTEDRFVSFCCGHRRSGDSSAHDAPPRVARETGYHTDSPFILSCLSRWKVADDA